MQMLNIVSKLYTKKITYYLYILHLIENIIPKTEISMFKENKLSGAIRLALATTMVFSLAGCLVEGSESVSTSGGTVTQVTNPTGTVQGHVQDTNGNPLTGVTVYLGGASTTTDAGGNYTFANVGVTNAAGADSDTAHKPLSITVAAPTGYLGATVTVKPEAQVDGTETNAAYDSTPTLFIDGFTAQAGTAVLPALTSSVSGVLRDADTEEAISNVVIRLDMTSVSVSGQQQAHDGVDSSYATSTYSATTGTDGSFSFSNLPDDTTFRYMIEGYEGGHVGNSVGTTDESVLYVGNVYASPIIANDTENPYVTHVTTAIDGGVGLLNDDINNDFVVNFSETIDPTLVDTNSIVVWDDMDGYQTVDSATFAADNKSITIHTANDIAAGAEVHIFLLVPDFVDTAGNVLITANAIDYDNDISANSGAPYVRLDLQVFTEANLNAPAVTDLAQSFEDDLGTDDYGEIQDSNSVFTDVDDIRADLQQLNSSDNDDGLSGYDVSERLSALASALNGAAVDVETNIARVTMTPTGASSYIVSVLDGNGEILDPAASEYEIYDGSASITPVSSSAEAVTIEISGMDPVFALISDMEPGYTVIVTPTDDLGHAGTPQSLVLVDAVEPTTVLQNSYGVTPVENGQVTTVDFGNGGELISNGVASVGTPYLNVTPMLLDNLDNSGDSINLNSGSGNDNTLEYELFDLNTVDTAGTGSAYIPRTDGMYDSVAYAAMDTARAIGVAMSEDISLTATAPTYTGTNAALSGYTAHNDVTMDDEGDTVNADLVDVQVDDVFSLAADNGAVLDFTGSITDNAGNTATADNNPAVVMRDAMPPMVTSAIYNGHNFVVTFNEAVAIDTANDTIVVGGMTIGLTNSSLDATNTILTILPEDDSNGLATGGWIDDVVEADLDGYGNLNRAAVFALAQYTESGVTLQSATDGSGHARLVFGEISDAANGNNWDNNSAGITAPDFAAIDATGNFQISSTLPTATAAEVVALNGKSFSWTFTHPLDFQTVFGGCGGSISETGTSFTMDDTGVLACFTVAGAAPAASGGASYSKSTRVLTVNIEDAGAGAGDVVSMTANGGNAVGEYDSADTFVVPDITLQ